MSTSARRRSPASCTSGRFPWDAMDQGPEELRRAAAQQAAVARAIVQQMTRRGVSQRDLERAGIASQSTISALLTGKSWTDMWVLTRVVDHLGGTLEVKSRQ